MMQPRILASAVLGATLALASAATAQDPPTRGWLHVVWDGDRTPDNPDGVQIYLVDAAGRGTQLLLDGGAAQRERLIPLDRHRVEVSGPAAVDPRSRRVPALRVRAVRDVGGPAPRMNAAPANAVAPTPFITLMCKYGDDPREPFPKQTVQRITGGFYPGVASFYGEMAGDPDVMKGNTVAGWFTLPKPRGEYVDIIADLGGIVRDCVAAADPTVDFTGYVGINIQLNGALNTRATPPYDTLSFGGSWTVSVDGQPPRQIGVTWFSRQHVTNYVVYPHEMGHALGWPHSSGEYGQEYDSNWDLMSRGYVHYTKEFGYVETHTIAPYKDARGWIPPARRWTPADNTRQTAVLERSAVPGPDGYLIAVIPAADGTFFTAETRRTAGYDTPLPGEAVLLHRVRNGRAYVVDPDNNGNPNDEGAMWRVGETFTDAVNHWSLKVEGETATGFTITITRGTPDVPLAIASDSVRRYGRLNLPYADTLRAIGTATAGLTWSITAGALPAGVALDAATGVLGGSPTQPGVFRFTATAVAGPHTDARAMRLNVLPPLAFTGDSLRRAGMMGGAYADSLRAEGVGLAARWRTTSGALPEGVTLDSLTGVIAGIPTVAGSFAFSASVTEDGQRSEKAFSIAVGRPQLQAAAVMDQLLGSPVLTPDQARYLDLAGNRNGRVDVGDVRAWLADAGQLTAAKAAELRAVIDAMDPQPTPRPEKRP